MAETAENRVFRGQVAIFGVFRVTHKSVFRRIFYGCRIFDGQIFQEKKLMMLLDVHYKYLGLIRITCENIKKVKWVIF